MEAMDALTFARWQFGITTVYHFLFVPLSIGLVFLVAVMQTLWLRTRERDYLRMTRLFGKLFLVNFAMGVATGIVQEFQFGMNWSSYSRFVGDVFGAPLAVEGLLAFFMESTFLGLWIFGWGRLPERLHLATIWLVALGTNLSAFFILAANSWMQHPVGYHLNPTSGRAEMTDFLAVLGNPTLLVTYPHTALASLLTGALFVLAVSAWHLLRGHDVALFRRASALGLVFGLIGALGVALSGHAQAQVMTQQQPMKMAAAEALYRTERDAGFSLFAIGTPDGSRLLLNVTVPHALSVLATNTWDGEVKGIQDVQAEEAAAYGPGSYTPVIPVTYWSFRLMVLAGLALAAFALWGLVLLRRGRLAESRWFQRLALPALALPFAASSLGWIFTEMGRQPWVVYGLLGTASGVSPSVGTVMVAATLAGFTLLYAGLAVVDGYLMLRIARAGVGEESPDGEAEPLPLLAY
jgi:cytochrome d ubiquinol oxidase subunit I